MSDTYFECRPSLPKTSLKTLENVFEVVRSSRKSVQEVLLMIQMMMMRQITGLTGRATHAPVIWGVAFLPLVASANSTHFWGV
jgi:hypothetical protein